MNRKVLIVIGLGIALLLLLAFVVNHTTSSTTGNDQTAASPSATPTPSTRPTPHFNSDIKTIHIEYFVDDSWLVATVETKQAPGVIQYIVMYQQNHAYQTVAGPAPSIDATGFVDYPGGVPADLVEYLQQSVQDE